MGKVPNGGKDGAGDRIRTGDINLGKVALYQLSYSRSTAELSLCHGLGTLAIGGLVQYKMSLEVSMLGD